jgi:hypothetical protein
MVRTRFGVLALAVLCAPAATPLFAADLIATLQGCAAMSDDAQRLSCYDKAMSRTSVTPAQTFGLSNAQVAKQEKLPSVEPKKITAKVTAISQQPQGGLLVTLEGDQMWAEQDAGGGYFALKVGDSVTVKPGLMGGFLMSGPASGQRAIRVRRVK